MNTARYGNGVEVKLAKQLEDEGWIVGSRRHIAGPGDLLAVSTITGAVMLIEVKATARGPWAGFGPQDRNAMLTGARSIRARPVLVWWPKGNDEPEWFYDETWPR